MTRAAHESRISRVQKAVSRIHPTLQPLMFQELDGKGPVRSTFDEPNKLAAPASAICKFAGLMVQAYWLLLRVNDKEQPLPRHLHDHLLQIWAGKTAYEEGSAISVLQEAASTGSSSSLGFLVRDPEVFVLWGDHLRQKSRGTKSFLVSVRSVDWYSSFIRLLDALPILLGTEFDGAHFLIGGRKILAFPFVRFSASVHHPLYLSDFEVSASRTKVEFADPYSEYVEDLFLDEYPDLSQQYQDIRDWLGLRDVRENVLYLFGSGYKHIQDLSKAISNTPS